MVLIAGPVVLAQNEMRGVRQDQIESFKIAFYTKRLDLSSQEAQQFWPVFNAYSAELEGVRKETMQLQQRIRTEYPTGSEAEIEDLTDLYIGLKRKEFMITEAYHEKFKTVLPVRKVVLLYKVENDFKKELLKEIRRRRMENRRR